MIAYLVFVCILGIPIMITEMALGRKSAGNPVQAYEMISKKASITGWIGVIAAFLILSTYSVVGGWILKYCCSYFVKGTAPESFGGFISQPVEPVIWLFVFLFLTALICMAGVSGIEKTSKIMMPGLFILLLIIIGRSVTLPGAGKGLAFVFSPEGSSFNISSVNAALGQVFYSLSLCMGITITYGSYLNKKGNIPKSCLNVAGLDTAVAILAGIAIFPAVFSFGLEPGQGPGLILGTLPNVFSSLKGGRVFAVLFFVLVLFAALTSAVALLEVCVSFAIRQFGFSRKKTVAVLLVALFLLGIPSALSEGPLAGFKLLNCSFFDFLSLITDDIMLPAGGVLLCYYVGWKWKPAYLVEEIEQEGVVFKLKKLWVFCIRFITPVLVGVVTISGLIAIYNTIMK